MAVYLLVRVLAAAFSEQVPVSLANLAKDWRLLAIFVGASGIVATASRNVLFGGLAVVLLVSIGVGIRDFLNIPWSYHWRTSGLLSTPMTLGGVAMLLVFLPFTLAFTNLQRSIVAVGAIILLVMSATKSSFLGLFAGGAVLLFYLKISGRIKFALVVSIIVIMTINPGTRQRFQTMMGEGLGSGSLGDRVVMWQAAVDMGSSQLFGVGPGNFGYFAQGIVPDAHPAMHAHNIYMQSFAEGGWPGLLGLLCFFFGFLYSFLTGTTSMRIGIPLLVATCAAGMFEVNFYDGEFAILFFLMCGMATTGNDVYMNAASSGLDAR